MLMPQRIQEKKNFTLTAIMPLLVEFNENCFIERCWKNVDTLVKEDDESKIMGDDAGDMYNFYFKRETLNKWNVEGKEKTENIPKSITKRELKNNGICD